MDDGDGETFENLHGVFVADERYALDNSPFYVYGVSLGDVVTVREWNGRLLFESVAERGGHSTYRVKLPLGADHEHFERYWPKLATLGCSYEGSSANERRLYSIDIPPGVDVGAAYAVLDEYERAGAWEFEEVHYCNRRH